MKSNGFAYLQFVYSMKLLEPDRFDRKEKQTKKRKKNLKKRKKNLKKRKKNLKKRKLLSLQAICIVFTHLIRLLSPKKLQ